MAHEIVDLTHDSPPASPKTPVSTFRPLVGSSSSAPAAVMQNERRRHWRSLEQHEQPEPLPKGLRTSSEPTSSEPLPNQSRPSQIPLVRSSSEIDMTRSGTQPVFDGNRLQRTCSSSKVQLTQADHPKFLQTEKPVDRTTTAVNRSSIESEKPIDVASAVTSEKWNLKMLIEWAKKRRIALVPASCATAPLTSAPAVSSPVPYPPVSSPLAVYAPFEAAPVAPLVWTASEWHIPETLRLFPVETPFFPEKSERGNSSRAGWDENDVDLSVFRENYRPKMPEDMDWTRAMQAAHHYNDDEDELNLDLSL